jgi:hypothetical protein
MGNTNYDCGENVEATLVVYTWIHSQFEGPDAVLRYSAAVEPVQYRRSTRSTRLAK